ncbi:FadR/GntR family transcriptional regulator [Parafrankia sp. EUN1f]|uniref:FadR/GntR family transcriptional regulator n=1 Tax=Parafrankia sp. EUN1f TaxID=102897 RepID=UPI0001C43A94|nr:GntR family transcriptional regulator [Parafrankia sp. EUN1f]EFC83857.1 regulatory protein GntR HTH [Parafrankia sp. EUN1f]
MPTSRPGRVSQVRIAETVAAALRERILTGDYQLPTQDQLVGEFGVSYPSVREAIRILETEGLVTVRRGKVGGADVHRPDETSAAYHLGLALQAGRVTLGDLAVGLQTFEPQCAAQCALATAADRSERIVPALRANIEATTSLVGSGDGSAFTHAAREFHELVVALTPNATIRHIVGSLVALWSAQERTWAESVTSRGEYPDEVEAEQVVRAHRRLLTEITAGRATAAERIARAHLVASQAYLLDRFDDSVVTVTNARPLQAPGVPSPLWRV